MVIDIGEDIRRRMHYVTNDRWERKNEKKTTETQKKNSTNN